jgi:antitoxin component of RelBE/YafQ-DinJ toxin-antitoxin module
MSASKRNIPKTGSINIKVEPNLKNQLFDLAESRGMNISTLARAVLTNFVKPGTFTL